MTCYGWAMATLKVKTVQAVVTTDNQGRQTDSLPVIITESGPYTNSAGRPVDPIQMVEDPSGVPVRIVVAKSVQDSAGHYLEATPARGLVTLPDYYADSAAAPGGNGTIGSPFNTLAALTAVMTAGKTAQLTGTFRETLTVPANDNRFTGTAVLNGSTALTAWTAEAASVAGPTSNIAMGGTFAGAAAAATPPTGWTVTANGVTWSVATDTSIAGQTTLTFTLSNNTGASKNFVLKSPAATVAALTAYTFTGYFAVVAGVVPDYNWVVYGADAGFATYAQDYPLGLGANLKKFSLPITTTAGITAINLYSQLTIPNGTNNLQVKITVFRLETGAASTVSLTPAGYYATLATDPAEQVFRNDVRLWPAATRGALATGKYWWDDPNDRLYIFDDPTGQSVEYSARKSVEINGKTGVTIDGLAIVKGKGFGLYGHGGCTNLTVKNCVLTNSDENASVRDFNGSNGAVALYVNAGVSFINCASSLARLNGISLGNRTDYARITNCTSYRDAQSNTGEDYTGGFRGVSDLVPGATEQTLNRPPNVVFSGCTVSYAGCDGAGVSIVTGERGHGLWLDTMGDYSSITGCTSHHNVKSGVFLEWGTSAGVTTACNSSLSYNICYANETGVLLSRRTNGAIVEHNTSWGNYRNLWILGDTVSETGYGFKNNIVRNNIAYAPLYGGPCLQVDGAAANPGGTGTGNTYPNNALGAQGAGFVLWAGAPSATYAEAVAASAGAIANSITTDPLLVNPPTDFHLQAGSPCKAPAASDGGNVGALGIAA